MHQQMQKWLANGQHAFRDAQCVHLCGDGKRFGCPAEEILQLAAWTPEVEFGMFCPGQVPNLI